MSSLNFRNPKFHCFFRRADLSYLCIEMEGVLSEYYVYEYPVGAAGGKRPFAEGAGTAAVFYPPSIVPRWENGTRLPDATMITRIAKCLGAEVGALFQLANQSEDSPIVIIVDDSKAILTGTLNVLGEVMPSAAIAGFIWPREAIEYAKANRVALAILDIELGTASGFDLCDTLLEINSRTNIAFLTAYPDYALNAWKTEATSFMVKPLTAEEVREQLKKLRYPILMGGADR